MWSNYDWMGSLWKGRAENEKRKYILLLYFSFLDQFPPWCSSSEEFVCLAHFLWLDFNLNFRIQFESSPTVRIGFSRKFKVSQSSSPLKWNCFEYMPKDVISIKLWSKTIKRKRWVNQLSEKERREEKRSSREKSAKWARWQNDLGASRESSGLRLRFFTIVTVNEGGNPLDCLQDMRRNKLLNSSLSLGVSFTV